MAYNSAYFDFGIIKNEVIIMQDRLYKKSTLFLGLILVIDIAAIIWLFIKRDAWAPYGFKVIIIFVLAIFLLTFIYSYFDLNQDRIIIKRMIRNGDIALIKINKCSLHKIIKDARLRNKILWKLDVELYDQDMHTIKTSIIEKFAPSQTTVPKGFCFVVYNPKKPNNILIVPNMIISSISEFAPLVEEYEKNFKPTYLNVYYNKGLIIKTYQDSIKEEKEINKIMNNKD